MSRPLISVCILAGHGVDALDACLLSLRTQSSPPAFELLVGGDPGPEVLAVVRRHFPDAPFCRTVGLAPGGARNPLVQRASGELLLFLDDDVTVRPDLLGNLQRLSAQYPEATVFGGPNDTPPDSSRFEVVQGAVLSSLAGSGPVSRRYGARHSGFADERWFTLCNLAVRQKAIAAFSNDLVCAEENALLAELHRRGDLMRYEPSLRVFHRRRSGLGPFARQMYKYGRGRGELMRRDLSTVRLAYLIPSAWLVYLLAAGGLAATGVEARLLLAVPVLYCLLVLAAAVRIGLTLRRLGDAPLAAGLTVLVHACYGVGVLRGARSPMTVQVDAKYQWGDDDWVPASASKEPATAAWRGSATRPAVPPTSWSNEGDGPPDRGGLAQKHPV